MRTFFFLWTHIPLRDTSWFIFPVLSSWASLVAQMVKNLPSDQEPHVQSLGWKDPLEKEMATHASILTQRIPWTEEPGGLYSSWGRKESDTIKQLLLIQLMCIWVVSDWGLL